MAQVMQIRDIRHGGSVKEEFERCRGAGKANFVECIVEMFDALADAEATAQRQYGETVEILDVPIQCISKLQNTFREIQSDEHDHEQKERLMIMDLTGKTRYDPRFFKH